MKTLEHVIAEGGMKSLIGKRFRKGTARDGSEIEIVSVHKTDILLVKSSTMYAGVKRTLCAIVAIQIDDSDQYFEVLE